MSGFCSAHRHYEPTCSTCVNTTPPAATPPAGDAELMQWLQDAPRRLRTTATPLADIIPRLQQAADRLTALSDELKLAQDRVAYMQASIDQLQADRVRLDYMQKHLLRDASIRLEGTNDFISVNAWAISSANTDLREAVDAFMLQNKTT
jgi:hypothetical protein